MLISILKSKIHRATVTDANINYKGSITIDKELLEHAKIRAFERVTVASIDSGERLETYVIEGKRGSGEVCLNGAAAQKILKGDKIIIMAFALIEENDADKFKPVIIHVDNGNKIISEENHPEANEEC